MDGRNIHLDAGRAPGKHTLLHPLPLVAGGWTPQLTGMSPFGGAGVVSSCLCLMIAAILLDGMCQGTLFFVMFGSNGLTPREECLSPAGNEAPKWAPAERRRGRRGSGVPRCAVAARRPCAQSLGRPHPLSRPPPPSSQQHKASVLSISCHHVTAWARGVLPVCLCRCTTNVTVTACVAIGVASSAAAHAACRSAVAARGCGSACKRRVVLTSMTPSLCSPPPPPPAPRATGCGTCPEELPLKHRPECTDLVLEPPPPPAPIRATRYGSRWCPGGGGNAFLGTPPDGPFWISGPPGPNPPQPPLPLCPSDGQSALLRSTLAIPSTPALKTRP